MLRIVVVVQIPIYLTVNVPGAVTVFLDFLTQLS